MRTLFRSVIASLLFLVAGSVVQAEVKTVRMKIAGYLCGN